MNNNLNSKLKDIGKSFDHISAPDYLEEHFQSVHFKKKKKHINNMISRVAVIILCIGLIGYHFDAIAYYNKMLTGYEELSTDTIANLINEGKGQTIDKSYTFSDGTKVLLDGIMMDSNQLIVFYTVSYEKEMTNLDENIDFPKINGLLFSYRQESAVGQYDEIDQLRRWQSYYSPPYFFEKYMTFEFNNTDTNERGEIKFKLDRSKALKTIYKSKINQKYDVANKKLYIEDIAATPTNTVINGQIDTIVNLALDTIRHERIRPNAIDMDLLADDKILNHLGSSISSDNKGLTYTLEFDAIPNDTQSLVLSINSIVADFDHLQSIPLNSSIDNKTYSVHDQDITIHGVSYDHGNTLITFSSDESTVLSSVMIVSNGEEIELQETIKYDLIKNQDGTITNKRTMVYPGQFNDFDLVISKITHKTDINQLYTIF